MIENERKIGTTLKNQKHVLMIDESCSCDTTCECSLPASRVNPLGEKIGDASLVFSPSFLILFVSIWFLLKGDGFWPGIIAFVTSSIVSFFSISIYHKIREKKKKEKK